MSNRFINKPLYVRLGIIVGVNILLLFVIEYVLRFIGAIRAPSGINKIPFYEASTQGWQYEDYLIDPVLGYRLAPNEIYAKKLYPHSIHTDQYGFVHNGNEERSIAIPKDDNTYRIIVFGGSTVASWGATELSKNLTGRMEYYLNRLAEEETVKKYEVINAGVMGYYSAIEFLYYALDLIFLEPDMVIFIDGFNDQWGYREGPSSPYITSSGYYYNTHLGNIISFLQAHQMSERDSLKGIILRMTRDIYLILRKAFPNIFHVITEVGNEMHQYLSNDMDGNVAKKGDGQNNLFSCISNKDKYKQSLINIIGVSKINDIKVALFLQPGLNEKSKKYLTDIEREILSELQRHYHWNKTDAAEAIYKDIRDKYHDGRDVWIENLFYLFQDDKERMYFDVAHYTDQGLDNIAKHIYGIVKKMNSAEILHRTAP